MTTGPRKNGVDNNTEIQENELNETMVKVCWGCGQGKTYSLFHLKGHDKFGIKRYQSTCKDCANKNRIARYKKKKTAAKTLAKPTYKFALSQCEVEIINHECDSSSSDIKEFHEGLCRSHLCL